MPVTPDALSAQTPQQIDTALAEVHQRLYRLQSRLARALADQKAPYYGRNERDVAATAARVAEAQAAFDEVARETEPYDAEFQRRDGWTRVFLVTSSSNGHVHSSRSCSTCQWTTEFIWLPEYSGADEERIVDDAGERACTVCYPTAPAETRQRATRIFSVAEKDALAAREQRARDKEARAAEQAIKGITAPDGAPLRLESWGEVKTVRTAQTVYVDRAAEKLAHDRGLGRGFRIPYPGEEVILIEALAHKWGVPVSEAEQQLASKVEARIRRDYM